MKGAPIGETSRPRRETGTNWTRLSRMSDDEIRQGIASDPDAHATDVEFWKSAKLVWPSRKAVVTMRLDSDLLEWFRQQRGYQTRINAILRAYMDAQTSDRGRETQNP